MAEYVSASIRVGGKLSVAALPHLIRLIGEERLGPNWNEGFKDEGQLRTYLSEGAAGIALFSCEVAGGEFEGLQAFCVQHGLTYVLTYDGCSGSWSAGRRIRRPQDRGDGLTCTLDDTEGFACISADQIRRFGLHSVEAILAHLRRFDDAQTPAFIIDESVATPQRGDSSWRRQRLDETEEAFKTRLQHQKSLLHAACRGWLVRGQPVRLLYDNTFTLAGRRDMTGRIGAISRVCGPPFLDQVYVTFPPIGRQRVARVFMVELEAVEPASDEAPTAEDASR